MMYVRRLFAELTNFIRHGHAEAEMNREGSAPGAALGRIETKPREEFAMRTIRIGSVACTLAIVAAVSLAPSHAQPASQTPQAALTKEAGTLSDKFSGLARVMAGKYDWKPGEGVRSVGDVFNLIVMENGTLAGTLTGAGGGRGGAPITDPEKVQAALKTSYANLQKTIEGLSDSDLKAPVKLFGKEMTKESAIRYLFGDQHEHLGQSIAYARTNGVIPPWSK
jgi:uncharacterized damage-inducible protein DinB